MMLQAARKVSPPCTASAAALAFVLLTGGCGGGRSETARPDPTPREVCTEEEAMSGRYTCRTASTPYIRYDDAEAFEFGDLPVKLFFYPQGYPEGTEILAPLDAKSVVPMGPGGCRDAGVKGLKRLQRAAARRGANAVINIRATWAGEQMGDDLMFGCLITKGRYALIWEGSMARIPETVATSPGPDGTSSAVETAPDGGPPPPSATTAERLRELQSLYFQGLISREEFEQRRQNILDGI